MLTRHHPLSGRLARASALLLLLLALGLPAFGAPNEILLAAGSLDTRQPVAPPADPSLRIAPPDPDESAHWIVHWNTDVSTARKDELRSLGAELLGYLPERAWLVRMTGAQAAAAGALGSVDYVGLWQPAYALSPEIGTHVYQDPERRADTRLRLVVDLFPGVDANLLAAGARKLGAALDGLYPDVRAPRLRLRIAPERLHDLARLPGVAWIEEQAEYVERNNNVVWIVQTAQSGNTAIWDHGIRGEGQVLGHIDSGFVESSCYFDDPDGDAPGPTHRKVVYQADSNSSTHGTHTAGTAVGNQTPVTGASDYNGVAPEARMATSRYNAGGFNLYTELANHYSYGARVHTNSWGNDGTTAYTSDCRDIDRYSRDYEDAMVAFAETNTSTLKTPENAKNVLAVAATNNPNYENHGSGGTGPTADGRRKPEIYAPGCSNRSASTSSCSTVSLCGTSMACPAIAGSGLLVRQYYTDGFYPSGAANAADAFTPSGALLRATLINGTFDMTGVAGYPSNLEGWGRLQLDESLSFTGDARHNWVTDVRNADGLQTGDSTDYPLIVNSAAEALKVTMVFTDPPATVGAAQPIINNLDLELIAPDQTSYRGNVFSGGQSAPGGSFDPINTVERVVLDAPQTGSWTVRIHGTDIPDGPQGYAVVAGGDVSVTLTAVPDGGTVAAALPRLGEPQPNPFNPKTTLRFSLPHATRATVAIFDIAGRRLATLAEGSFGAGDHVVEWNGRDGSGKSQPSGVYFARLEAEGLVDMRKLTLLK